ncbi:hypothetical protein FB45DRAFT_739354 [Roridomyces roridus]|uniref:RNA polymerase II assembly factor Rtp1 C-terminal domain-containing protein n=1 Tax=Roridomyces roridus TaxID=1738132 RepID=A0AAD7C4A3_9AGAR|nr:hypothetical protein FB45DRAFT_739354 [Roridomyces roridus]
MSSLKQLLAAGACLVDTTPGPDLKSILASRLTRCYECLEKNEVVNASQDLELATAVEALDIVEGIHKILASEDTPFGTRDLAQLRTLLAVAFKWGVDPAIRSPEHHVRLSSMVSRLLDIALALDEPTFVTTSLLNRHLDQLLRPCITIGWKASEGEVRSRTVRLLGILSPSQTITALGAVLSIKPAPTYVRKACGSLLSKQLLRPDGVRGLCEAVFGEETDDVQLEKIEHVARVLTTAPVAMSAEDYYTTITPRVLELLSDRAPQAYRRAGAFSISRMLETPAAPAVLAFLHPPFLSLTPPSPPRETLSIIMNLVTNTDPSPTLISSLLSPIVSALYSLLYHLDQVKTSDPSLKEMLRGLLGTWGRVVGSAEGVEILWSVVEGQGGSWRVDLEGNITRLEQSEKPPSLDLMTPADEEIDPDANILDLYPDPAHFARFLKFIQRMDVSSDLFVRLLEAYRESKSDDENPTQTLLYLQLVVQLQTSTTLGKPAHILSFIKHTLERPEQPKPTPTKTVPYQLDIEDEGGDSDDDTPGADIISPDDEMIETSVNLLLAVLEANEDLSARTDPILNDIFSLLEPLALTGSSEIQPLAREARMVMTARLASTSAPRRRNEKDDNQETYQKALKLLQDPILPVRAHGLLLLRQLVAPKSSLDPALVPAILSIFLQSVQEDDSYMFLNAVQGLAAMVDTYGKNVLSGLVQEYGRNLEGHMVQHDMDVRTRVGEALASVIKRCGSALPAYSDILVPPLLHIVRSSQVPTTLRTSALSLLAECENTCPLALAVYSAELSEAMIDLLQIESTSTVSTETEDSNPTSKDPKLPSFRRAAIHFLGILIRQTTNESGRLLNRIKITLSYVAATDADMVVRVMAREAVEELSELLLD